MRKDKEFSLLENSTIYEELEGGKYERLVEFEELEPDIQKIVEAVLEDVNFRFPNSNFIIHIVKGSHDA